jgi:hypothetical protein
VGVKRGHGLGRLAAWAAVALVLLAASASGVARAGVGPTVTLGESNGGVISLTDDRAIYYKGLDSVLTEKTFADGTESPVSVLPDGSVASSVRAAASANGRFVVFSEGSAGGTWIRDLESGVTTALDGAMAGPVAVSNDGSIVILFRDSGYLVIDRATGTDGTIVSQAYPVLMDAGGDTIAWLANGQIVVYDVATGTTENLGGPVDGSEPNDLAIGGPGGQFLVWGSCDGVCPRPGFIAPEPLITELDRSTGAQQVVGRGVHPAISANGRYVAWDATAHGDPTGDVELLDTATGIVRRANIGADGYPIPGDLNWQYISNSGAVAWMTEYPRPQVFRVHWTDQTGPPIPSVPQHLADGRAVALDGRIPIHATWYTKGPICLVDILGLRHHEVTMDGRHRRGVRIYRRSGTPSALSVTTTDCEGDRSGTRQSTLTAWAETEHSDQLRFDSSWHTARTGLDLDSHVRVSRRDGAQFTWNVPAGYGEVAIVAPVGPHRGVLTVRGSTVLKIDLYAPRPSHRHLFVIALHSPSLPVVFTAHLRGTRSSVAIDGIVLSRGSAAP